MTALCSREVRTFANNAALTKGTRVKYSAGYMLATGLTEVELGVVEETVLATDVVVPVRLARNTERRIASAAITAFATVYRAASGKISSTASGAPYGIALEAASGDGSIIEVMPFVNSTLNLGAVTGGLRFASGSAAALDGSNPTPVATGLTTIVAAGVQLRGTAAPGDNTSVLTTDYSGADGTLNVYAWKNTGGTDPTLVASTGTETFDWWAVGT